ncbi:MAG: sigma factor-like helix-turn-helix DNA-binding protein [Anaerostipes hadrus]
MIDLDSLKQKSSRMHRRHRDTLLFRYVYGLKCKEIADIFKISERMVKIRCSTRVQLKKMMEEDEL